MEKINWGIIGLGNIAHKFSEAFREIENSKLLAAASNDKKKLNVFKEKYDFEDKFLFNNYDELINCKDIDIIYIALPNFLHHKWVIKCIQNNKNVLVEKPATINLSEANDIKKNLHSKNLFFGEAFMYRYNPQISSIINLIKDNKIGKPLSMKSYFGNNVWFKRKLFFFKKKKKINPSGRLFNIKLGGGCILDLGCYPSSFSLLIASLIKNIDYKNFKMLDIKKDIGETGVDVDASAVIKFEGGFTSVIKSSFKKDVGSQSIINGKKGSITIHDTWFGDVIKKNIGNRIYELKKRSYTEVFSYEIENISTAILKNLKEVPYPGMSLEETLLNTRVLEEWLYA